MTRYTLADLMDQQTPGGKGLLAAELLGKTDRRDGPVDGRCEVCGQIGQDVEIWLLQDWLRWHCESCAISAHTAEWAEMAAAVGAV